MDAFAKVFVNEVATDPQYGILSFVRLRRQLSYRVCHGHSRLGQAKEKVHGN